MQALVPNLVRQFLSEALLRLTFPTPPVEQLVPERGEVRSQDFRGDWIQNQLHEIACLDELAADRFPATAAAPGQQKKAALGKLHPMGDSSAPGHKQVVFCAQGVRMLEIQCTGFNRRTGESSWGESLRPLTSQDVVALQLNAAELRESISKLKEL